MVTHLRTGWLIKQRSKWRKMKTGYKGQSFKQTGGGGEADNARRSDL